jgi:hypothetical protein
MGRLPLRGAMAPGLLTTMTLNVAAGESNDAKRTIDGWGDRFDRPIRYSINIRTPICGSGP